MQLFGRKQPKVSKDNIRVFHPSPSANGSSQDGAQGYSNKSGTPGSLTSQTPPTQQPGPSRPQVSIPSSGTNLASTVGQATSLKPPSDTPKDIEAESSRAPVELSTETEIPTNCGQQRLKEQREARARSFHMEKCQTPEQVRHKGRQNPSSDCPSPQELDSVARPPSRIPGPRSAGASSGRNARSATVIAKISSRGPDRSHGIIPNRMSPLSSITDAVAPRAKQVPLNVNTEPFQPRTASSDGRPTHYTTTPTSSKPAQYGAGKIACSPRSSASSPASSARSTTAMSANRGSSRTPEIQVWTHDGRTSPTRTRSAQGHYSRDHHLGNAPSLNLSSRERHVHLSPGNADSPQNRSPDARYHAENFLSIPRGQPKTSTGTIRAMKMPTPDSVKSHSIAYKKPLPPARTIRYNQIGLTNI
jgi:hypothetical protein